MLKKEPTYKGSKSATKNPSEREWELTVNFAAANSSLVRLRPLFRSRGSRVEAHRMETLER